MTPSGLVDGYQIHRKTYRLLHLPKMEAVCSLEILVLFYKITRHHIPQDSNLHSFPLEHALATLLNGKGAWYGPQRWCGYGVEEGIRHYQTFTNKTEDYISREQQGGFSIRWPLRSSWNSFSTLGTDGYGVPPKVMISHSRMPYDHLQQTHNIKLNSPVPLTPLDLTTG